MRHVVAEAAESHTELESGEGHFVDDDGGEAGQRYRQAVAMKQCDAEQRQREQDEIDGDSKQQDGFNHWGSRYRVRQYLELQAGIAARPSRRPPRGLLRMRSNTSPAPSAIWRRHWPARTPEISHAAVRPPSTV